MKNILRNIQFALLGILVLPGVNAGAQTASDSILLSAMRDELYRNLEGLSDTEGEKPFFIAYTIANAKTYTLSASLGALNRTQENAYKDWNVRLMVGDYAINDENFSSNQPQEVVFRPTINMPVEDDYLGIRRSLWLTTNNVYFSALKSYKNKMSLIENEQITKEDLEIDDFSKAPVVKKRIYSEQPEINIPELENKIRNLSERFAGNPDIFSSSVSSSVFTSTVYFVNSEGSEVQVPFNIITLTVQAGSMADDSDPLNKSITYVAAQPGDLPAQADLEADIDQLIENTLLLRNTPRYTDTYYGPVLLQGEVAAETLERFLFAGSDALIASRETLQSGSQQSVYYQQSNNSLQSRIDKSILSKNMSVIATPFLKEYNGEKLLGSFEVDAEGVIPDQELVLVEKGILKTLLNGRTPSREIPESNGYTRLDYGRMGLNKQVGPGVIQIKTDSTYSEEALKEKLMKKAKENGYEYALLIRSLDVGGSDKPFNFYLVDVETGEETLSRSVRLSNLTMQALRQDPLFSDSVQVHNTLLSTQGSRRGDQAGIPSSFIVPNAVLLNNVEMESTRKPLTSLLPIIENPVQAEKAIHLEPEED